MIKYFVFFFIAALLNSFSASAEIRLPQLIKDHMVLQRSTELKIWGWAAPGERVSISFNKKKAAAITGADGKWLVHFPPMKAGGPFTMVIKGNNEIILTDILLGDVWFCSGQSNMVLPMERLKEKYPDEVANDHFPEIRNFFVPTSIDVSKVHEDMPPGDWISAVGSDILKFGGLTYFFTKQLYKKYHVPIGIINSSVGGFTIDAWISAGALKEFPDQEARLKNISDSAYMKNLFLKFSAGKEQDDPTVVIPDKGLSGPVKWTDTGYVPERWHSFWLPGYWSDQGVKDLHGILYFRKEINVPASMTGKAAKLFMGRIVDADSTFVNGKFVGNITYQYPPRRYDLPAGLLKPGKNIIVIKVVNTSGKGGFAPDKNYSLAANGEKIDLRGDWTYQVAYVQNKPHFDSGDAWQFQSENSPTGLYNTMVAPAANYAIKGFLWYQGEADCSNPKPYAKMLRALINSWRANWNEGEIPFLYVQLPGFMEVNYSPSESDWAELRQSQLKALVLPNTGMAVALDAGEWNDVHPLNKKDIGDRLALWAERLAYADENVVCSGPIYQSHKIEGNKIAIGFSHVGGGLTVRNGGELYYFSIAGADKKFVWARAKIEGDQVIVWSDEIKNPVTVRYAWADNPEGANLYNQAGLPASPFETFDK